MGLIARLLAIPFVPTMVGAVLMWLGFARILAGATPPLVATCASPELATTDHVVLHDCDVVDVLVEPSSSGRSSSHWVVLAARGSPVPVVAAHVLVLDGASLAAAAEDYLAHAELEVVRTRDYDRNRERFRDFPAIAEASLVGEWREPGQSPFDAMSLFYLGMGVMFVGADGLRLLRRLVVRRS